MSVTPIPGVNSEVTTGGDPVVAVAANPAGGFIVNPPGAPGYLYVNPIDDATTDASGNTFAIAPGASWTVIAGQTTPTSVNSEIDGHQFSVVSW